MARHCLQRAVSQNCGIISRGQIFAYFRGVARVESVLEAATSRSRRSLYASAGQHAHFEYLTPNFVFGECSLKKPVICLWKEKCER